MSKASDAATAAAYQCQGADAIALAYAGVKSGDADAISLLAHWHLVGEIVPRDLRAARTLLARAADAGHTHAAFTLIALTANGSGGPPDWVSAVTLLKRLAAQGNQEARRQLAMLARMMVSDTGAPKALTEAEVIAHAPQVRRWRALITPDECALVAHAAQDFLAPSAVADPQTGRMIAHPVRNSSAAVIGPTRETLPLQAILRRIAAVTDTQVSQGEALTVLHYAPGQQYHAHMDTLPHEGNQRIMTLILYLNHGYDGGGTYFPGNGLTINGRAGDAICFDNVTSAGEPDPASRHAGLPIKRGTKWIATRWIRARGFDPWNLGVTRDR